MNDRRYALVALGGTLALLVVVALGSDRANDDIADDSLAVDKKSRRRTEDTIGPLHPAV